jgi:hypothetical protein
MERELALTAHKIKENHDIIKFLEACQEAHKSSLNALRSQIEIMEEFKVRVDDDEDPDSESDSEADSEQE